MIYPLRDEQPGFWQGRFWMMDAIQGCAGSKNTHLALPHIMQLLISCNYGAFAFATNVPGVDFHIP